MLSVMAVLCDCYFTLSKMFVDILQGSAVSFPLNTDNYFQATTPPFPLMVVFYICL